MKGVIVALALLAVLVTVTDTQSTSYLTPNIVGRWDDTVCNLIPNSDQIYQKRTIAFGDYVPLQDSGPWEATTLYYQGNLCEPTQESYRTTYLGTYRIGLNSTQNPGFSDIEYRISSKTMQIYYKDFLDYIGNVHSCGIANANIEQFIDIRHTDCYPLQLVPIQECPIMYDIIRNEGDRIWVGNQFPGNGAWIEPCQTRFRPQEYSPYGLGLFVTVVGLGQSTFNLQPYIEENIPYNFDFGPHLGIDNIIINPSNMLYPSLLLLSLIQFVLF